MNNKQSFYLLSKLLEPIVSYPNKSVWKIFNIYISKIFNGKNRLIHLILATKISVIYTITIFVFPITTLFFVFPYRFLKIDLSQIGSILYLDSFLRDLALTEKKIRKYRVIVYRGKGNLANAYLLNMYKRKVIFIDNFFLQFLFLPFIHNPLLHKNTFKYDLDTRYSHPMNVWREYAKRNLPNIIEMSENDSSLCKKILESKNVNTKKIVTLHARESGFYGDYKRTSRNANINTYDKAIEYLIKMGYVVIRVGDHTMSTIGVLTDKFGAGIFDYANSDIVSEMMDCYLISNCDFHLGSSSGASYIPSLFGKNVCWTNIPCPAISLGFLKGDLTIFKHKIVMKNNEYIGLDKLFIPPLDVNCSLEGFEAWGFKLVDNTPDEILDLVKEYIAGRNEKNNLYIDYQIKARSFLMPGNYAYEALGEFSGSFIKKYLSI